MVIGAIVLLYFGLNYLKGLNVFHRGNMYYAVYADVSGINDASPVLFHGMKVGQVIRTEMLPDGSGHIAVSFQLSEDRLKLPKDSRAEIYSSDLFTRAIQLIVGTGPEFASTGDTLSGGAQLSLSESVSGQLDPIKKKAETMLANVDSLLTALQSILNVKTRTDIDASFTTIRATLENVKGTTDRINSLLDAETGALKGTIENMNKLSATLASHSAELGHIFTNVDSITSSLADGRLEKVLANVNATSEQLRQVMEKINGGQGTLGQLVKNDSLYRNMNSATRELTILLEDLHTNPNRYLSIFGKKDRLPKLSNADIERIQQVYQKQQGTKP